MGDALTPNHYSWHLLSHLLFIESPAGVGFSVNTDPSFEYNDLSTANDNFAALQSFFAGFPEYSGNPFWIAGESYAGKYIPDLAVIIDYNNGAGSGKAINLKGMMIGNGVMSFLNGELEKSSVEFMIDHEFIDVDLVPYYRGSCFIDAESAGCRYFKARYDQNVDEINPYNVYSYCFYNDSFAANAPPQQSQASILRNIAANKGRYEPAGSNGAPCAFFDGLLDYFTAHGKEYHALDGMKWNGPCVSCLRLRPRTSRASTTSTWRARCASTATCSTSSATTTSCSTAATGTTSCPSPTPSRTSRRSTSRRPPPSNSPATQRALLRRGPARRLDAGLQRSAVRDHQGRLPPGAAEQARRGLRPLLQHARRSLRLIVTRSSIVLAVMIACPMQHNFLSNYCLFYMTVQSRECFRMLSVLSSMSVVRLPEKRLEVAVFETRREVKAVARAKDKVVRSECELVVVRDEDAQFLLHRERGEGKGGHMAIGSRHCFDVMQRNRLLGDVVQTRSLPLAMESFVWESYVLTHYQVSAEKSLVLIQEMFSSTLLNLNNEEAELAKKTRLLFEPLLELLLSPERAAGELARFQKELRTLRLLYPEIDKEMDKEKGIVELNYLLVYYNAVVAALRDSDR